MIQCKALTNQLHIDVNGFYTPCCMMVTKNPKNLVASTSPKEWLASEELLEVKNKLKNGEWHKDCHVCQLAEDEGRESFRQIFNNEMVKPEGTIESIHLTTGNKCNNRCRMCDSDYSSRWAKTLKIFPVENELSFKNRYEKIKHLIGPNLTYLRVAGGEPFLYPEFFEVIELISEKCPKLNLQFNTNVTFFPEKSIHILDKIHILRPAYSIDGIGLVNDYIRHDSKWNTTVQVLNKWTDYIRSRSQPKDKPYFSTTTQAYNFHDQHNIKNFFDSYGLNCFNVSVRYPPWLKVNALPPEYIQKHTNEVNKKFVTNYKFDEKAFSRLKTNTIANDKLLGKHIQEYIPELYELLNS